MSRPRTPKPKYCLDKPYRRAFVIFDGTKKYLGRHGSQDSLDAYDRLIGEWIARGRAPLAPSPQQPHVGGVTVSQAIAAFWADAKRTYPAPPYQEG